MLLLAEPLDRGGQRAEISAGFDIDDRPFEVPLRAVDQRRERGSAMTEPDGLRSLKGTTSS